MISNSKEAIGLGTADSHASFGGPQINIKKSEKEINEVRASHTTLKNELDKNASKSNISTSPEKKISASIQSMHFRHR